MNLQVEIGSLKKELDKIDDAHLLSAIRELIKFAKQKNEERILAPFTSEQLVKRALHSEKDIRRKKVKSVAEVRSDVKGW